MPFFNRRFFRFLLLDAAVLSVLIGVFAAVNHAFVPRKPPLSDRILMTPGPDQPAPVRAGEDSSAVPKASIDDDEAPADTIIEAKDTDAIDLKRLRAINLKVAVHKVKLGENFWSIANENKISLNTLIGANPNMPFKTNLGQSLNILSRLGVLHTVGKNETPAQVAALYKVDEKIIEDENGVTWWKGLKEGDVLFIPGVKAVRMNKDWKDYFSKRGFFGDPLGHWAKINSAYSFRKDPITGEIRHHNGVDLKAKYGHPVYAAAKGKVVFTGVSGGYGNLIKIHHSEGYLTYYGHLSKILVKMGQKVGKGSLIGQVGATGRVTGPHLHFEVHKNGKPVDPLPLI